MSDYSEIMACVQRERKTEEQVRSLDASDIVEWIHRLEDGAENLEARLAEAREALLAIRDAVPGTDDAADRVQRIVSKALAGGDG